MTTKRRRITDQSRYPRPWIHIPIAAAMLLMGGCEQEDPVFERRYVLVSIPGIEVDELATLLDHEDPHVRYLAMGNLLQMGVLNEAGEDDGEEDEASRELFGKVRQLLDDKAARVRAIAAYAPSNRAGEGAEERLLALLDDPVDAVRVDALASLARISGKLTPAGTERVAALLEDDNVLVRLEALVTLGQTCSADRADAVAEEIAAKMTEGERFEHLVSMGVLTYIASDHAAQALLRALDSDDPCIVKLAAEGLAERQTPGLEEKLHAALGAGRLEELFAFRLLANVATERSREVFVSHLDDADSKIHRACRDGLLKIGDEAALDALGAACDERLPAAEESFGTSGAMEEQAFEELFALIDTLGELGGRLGKFKFDAHGLHVLLGSAKPHEKLLALRRLAKGRTFDGYFVDDAPLAAALVDRLTAMTGDASAAIRAAAYDALGHSTNRSLGAVLLGGVDDPKFKVRQRALQALRHHAAITADLTSLRKLHSKRDELLPVQYADDDSAWLLRSQLEQAARSFEPHWVAVARARREAGAGQSEPTRLIAAAYLAQEHEGGVDVLLELAESGGDDLIETAIAAATPSLDKSHSERLRKIVERVSNPEVKKELTEAIDQLDE